MGLIVNGRAVTEAPTNPLEIDWDNPQTRGLRSAYVLSPELWRIDLVTGQVGGSVAGVGPTFANGRLITPGSVGNGARLLHGLTLPLVAPVTFVVGARTVSGAVSWSLLRTDYGGAWSGVYGTTTGRIACVDANSFGGDVTAPEFGGDNYAFCLESATRLAGASPLGAVTDTSLVLPTSVNNPSIALGWADRGEHDNPAVASFSHFFVIQGARTDAELRDLADNPWQIFREAPRRVYFLPSPTGAMTHRNMYSSAHVLMAPETRRAWV